MRSPVILLVSVLTLAGCPIPDKQTYQPPDFARMPDLTPGRTRDMAGMDLAGMDLTPPTVEDLAPLQGDDLSVAMDMTASPDLTPVADLAPEADLSIPADMTPPAWT